MVLSGNVMAGEVYYCSDVDANGFFPENGKYKAANFTDRKFKMKLRDDGHIDIENPKLKSGLEDYICSTVYNNILPAYKAMKSCALESNNGNLFNFNPDNGRYTWFRGGGYVFNNEDTVSTRIGTCTKF